jgi:hypothetical protein
VRALVTTRAKTRVSVLPQVAGQRQLLRDARSTWRLPHEKLVARMRAHGDAV